MKFPSALLLAALLAACSGGTDEAAPVPVALVSLAPVEDGAVSQRVTLYGTVEAGAGGKAVLTAPAEAQVVRIVAPVGTQVRPGQVIALLSPAANTRLDLAKASSDARAADLAYARAQRLRADGLAGDAEVESARAAKASADATLTSLSTRAGAMTIRATAGGFVESVAVNPGDLVQQGATIATIARGGDLRARLGADPGIARALRPGAAVLIQPGGDRAAFAVPVESVAPMVDPQTRLASVFVRLPATSGLATGETLTGSVTTGGGGSGMIMPYAALLDDGGQPYVFVVAGGVAHRRDVKIGASEGDRVSVTQGVKAGDQVIVQGGTAVEDGMKVRTK